MWLTSLCNMINTVCNVAYITLQYDKHDLQYAYITLQSDKHGLQCGLHRSAK